MLHVGIIWKLIFKIIICLSIDTSFVMIALQKRAQGN